MISPVEAHRLLRQSSDAAPAAGRGLIEGSWVRQPLWIVLAQSVVLSVLLPALDQLLLLPTINAVTAGLLYAAIRIGDPGQIWFQRCLHGANAITIGSLYLSVWEYGFPGSLILYYAPIVLLATAHLLGARAAMAWSLPLITLVVASEFVPDSTRIEPPAFVSIIGEGGILVAVLALVVSLRHAYDRKALQLERLATTDSLTGLANRTELQLSLRHALSRAERFGRRGALVFIDLDGLKGVNDQLGHDAGDALLREQASRLRKLTRGIDVAARHGGDEFVVLLSEYDDPKGAQIFARKLLAALRMPCRVGDKMISPSASIGIAEFPAVATTAEALLACADEAMYAAKEAGGSRIFGARENGVAEIG
jgi:diguanylate cyclase (GGDEF)-like protein